MATRNRNSMGRPKKHLKDMDVDEFLADDFESGSESSTKSYEYDSKKTAQKSISVNSKDKSKSRSRISPKSKQVSPRENSGKGHSGNGNVRKVVMEKLPTKPVIKDQTVAHSFMNQLTKEASKQSLASALKENDPEFYDFLQGEDKSLLSNLEDLTDAESDGSEDEDDSSVQKQEPKQKKVKRDIQIEAELLNLSGGDDTDSDDENSSNVHKPPSTLEVDDSDESDPDSGEEAERKVTVKRKKGGILVTQKMIDKWSQSIQTNPSLALFSQIVSAFHAAVQEAGGNDGDLDHKYRIEGNLVFNSVVRLCLAQVIPCLQNLLRIPVLSEVSQPMSDKNMRWKKLKVDVKSYLSNQLTLLSQLSEAVMVNAIMKHVHKLIIFFASFHKLSKAFLKRMIYMWTTGEETTRVLAFLCISKLIRLKRDSLLEPCLKQIYMAYVSNCKFTSPTTLPQINFMQRSLVEIFNIDQTVAYQYAFIYIRQLAIHLRNAIAVKKNTTCQAVYNWQYIHCLGLWTNLLTTTYPSGVLEPLIYPITQTIIGTIKLVPTARFYPLRFHCVKMLNLLSSKTNTFIPTLPFLLELFDQTDFNKRHKTVSLKPFNFAVILKFSKSQLHEKAFKDGLIDQLYESLLETYNIHAYSVGFPELIIPSVIHLKEFLKKCKIANYCKQIKQIVDKIMEQSKFIVEKRKYSSLSLNNPAAVAEWEIKLADSPSPLRKYYTSWRKLRDRELRHEVAHKDAISGAAIDIPLIERQQLKKATPQDREDFTKLFENESDSEDESRFLLKEERPKQSGKKRKLNESDSEEYSDFDDEELQQLAESASSDEGSMEEVNDNSEEEDNSSDSSDRGLSTGKTKFVNLKPKVSSEDYEEDLVEDFVLSESD